MATVFYPVKRKGETRIAKMDHEDWLLYNNKKHVVHTDYRGKKPWYVTYKFTRSRPLMLHRLITMCEDGMYVDHINNDSLDNRKVNLRVCTIKQNNQNVKARKSLTGKYRGVRYNKTNKNYRARITCDGIAHEIGSFESEDDAVLAYNNKAQELFGEYAYINKLTREV